VKIRKKLIIAATAGIVFALAASATTFSWYLTGGNQSISIQTALISINTDAVTGGQNGSNPGDNWEGEASFVNSSNRDTLAEVTVSVDGFLKLYDAADASSSSTGNPYDPKYDINGDGNINATDLAILQVNLGKSANTNATTKKCDLDGDGTVTLADYVILQNYIAGMTGTVSGFVTEFQFLTGNSAFVLTFDSALDYAKQVFTGLCPAAIAGDADKLNAYVNSHIMPQNGDIYVKIDGDILAYSGVDPIVQRFVYGATHFYNLLTAFGADVTESAYSDLLANPDSQGNPWTLCYPGNTGSKFYAGIPQTEPSLNFKLAAVIPTDLGGGTGGGPTYLPGENSFGDADVNARLSELGAIFKVNTSILSVQGTKNAVLDIFPAMAGNPGDASFHGAFDGTQFMSNY